MYRLIKMSSDGFEVYSESPDQILSILESYICSECFMREVVPEYSELTTSEQIEELLWTRCGSEFLFLDQQNHPEDPPKRSWHTSMDITTYTIVLTVYGKEFSDTIQKKHWEACLYKQELLRCSILRLQKKAMDAIFPTYSGRFRCEWEL